MTLDDFLAFYVVFKEAKDSEICQVIFELIKISPHHVSNKRETQRDTVLMQRQDGKMSGGDSVDVFTKGDLLWLCLVTNTPEKAVRDFFMVTSFSPNFPITYEDFKLYYGNVRHISLFSWVPSLVSGFKEENMNLEPENEVKSYERRLSVQ